MLSYLPSTHADQVTYNLTLSAPPQPLPILSNISTRVTLPYPSLHRPLDMSVEQGACNVTFRYLPSPRPTSTHTDQVTYNLTLSAPTPTSTHAY